MNQSYLSKAITVIRLLLGILFLVSGIGKLISGSDADTSLSCWLLNTFGLLSMQLLL